MSDSIGVFGGTFDPIHLGHLIAAESARDGLGLTQVRFVPAGKPPHRDRGAVASDADRLAMARLAIEDRPGFHVDDREFHPGASPFTIDTLRSIAGENPNAEVLLIAGQDWSHGFHTWYKSQELLDAFQVIILLRPDHNGNVVTPEKPGFKYIENPTIGISSTDIRQRVKEGRSIHYLVPKQVEDYIKTNNLYL